MKTYLLVALLALTLPAVAQNLVNPIVKNFGGIYEIQNVDVKPDPTLKYNIVIDAKSGSNKPTDLNQALNNVARMVNLHAVAGVPTETLNVVVVIHNEATYSIMENESYKKKYNVENPNIGLIKELSGVGIQFVVCGQSLIGRQVDRSKIVSDVKVAVSMLTTVTALQAKGYSLLVF